MGRRRGKYSGFADGFSAGYDAVSRIADDYDKMQVRKTINDGLSKSKEEAAASGGTVSTLDKGLDSAAPDYASKNKSDIDMIAGQEDVISSMQSEIDGQKNPPPAVETMPLADEGRPRGIDIGLAEINAQRQPPAMSQVQTATAGLQPTAPLEPTPTAAPAAPQAPDAGYTRADVQTAKLDTMDIFHKKYAPDVISKLMSQGKIAEATAFEDWSNSAKGKSYGKAWMGAVQKEQMGDHTGALKDLQELYNKQLPDGQYATINTSKDGQSTVEVRDEKSHKLVNKFEAKAPDMTQALLGMGSPDKAWSYLQGQQAAASARQEKIADREAAHKNAIALEDHKAANKPETPSPLMRLQQERDAMAKANPKDPNIAVWDRKIKNVSSSGENGGIQVFTGASPDEFGNVYMRDKQGNTKTSRAPGAPNVIDQAQTFANQYEMKVMPGGKVPMLHVKGTNQLASEEEEKAYAQAQITIRRNNKLPGLK